MPVIPRPMKEYHYYEEWCDIRKDLFTNNPEELERMREHFKDNCVVAAEALASIFNSNGILCGILVFKSARGSAFLFPVRVQNELTGEVNEYTHHAVLVGGDYVIDVLYSDRIIKTREYIETLEKLNPGGIRLDSVMSSWYSDEGYQIVPTIEMMRQYKF